MENSAWRRSYGADHVVEKDTRQIPGRVAATEFRNCFHREVLPKYPAHSSAWRPGFGIPGWICKDEPQVLASWGT